MLLFERDHVFVSGVAMLLFERGHVFVLGVAMLLFERGHGHKYMTFLK
jgi:hypothetical protein